MRRLTLVLFLAACPTPPVPPPDSGMDVDSGMTVDAGRDAGHPVHDAGVDAGWVDVPEAQWCRAFATARCWLDLRCGRIDEALLSDCIDRHLEGDLQRGL